jgi:hypothetical protein
VRAARTAQGGLPHHGRENDCTPHEIMSVSGHASLKEVERYTKAADRKRLAARAQAKIAAAGNMVPLAVVGR